MVWEPMAAQVFGAITAKTVPVVLDYLTDRLKNILGKKSLKGKTEVEALKKEIDELKQKLAQKDTVSIDDVKQTVQQVQKVAKIQEQYGLELINDQAHKRWILDQFLELGRVNNKQPTFKIRIWTQKASSQPRDISLTLETAEVYNTGDKIRLFFCAEQDCYINVFNLGTSGNITMLFPNKLAQDNFIKEGKTYSVPGEGYPFEYVLSGPPGIERITAIAAAQNTKLSDIDFTHADGIFHIAERSAAAKDIQILTKQVMELSASAWTTTAWSFEVR